MIELNLYNTVKKILLSQFYSMKRRSNVPRMVQLMSPGLGLGPRMWAKRLGC